MINKNQLLYLSGLLYIHTKMSLKYFLKELEFKNSKSPIKVQNIDKNHRHSQKSIRNVFRVILFTHSPIACVQAKLLQSCLTLCDPMGSNPPGSSVHGFLQARTLEQVIRPSSRGSS